MFFPTPLTRATASLGRRIERRVRTPDVSNGLAGVRENFGEIR
jgi:hypothetical protein